MSIVTKLARMVIYLNRLLIIKLYKALIMWSCKVTTQSHYISITRVPMATKLGRMMTSLNGPLAIMSCDSLITWPYEIYVSLTAEVQHANA